MTKEKPKRWTFTTVLGARAHKNSLERTPGSEITRKSTLQLAKSGAKIVASRTQAHIPALERLGRGMFESFRTLPTNLCQIAKSP